MLQATDRTGESTVVLKEGNVGYLVTAHKEALPPHYSEEFNTYQEALETFAEMTITFDATEISEITEIVNREADPSATESEVLVALLDVSTDDVEEAAAEIIEQTWGE